MRKFATALIFACAAIFAQEAKVVRYADFGAKGDGKTDDAEAIAKAHAYANEHNLPVQAEDSAIYRIVSAKTAVIKTNTNWGKAKFLIDDSALPLEKRNANVFLIAPTQNPIDLKDLLPLRRTATNLGVQLPCKALVALYDKNIKRYIRYGANQNNGASQTDLVLAEKDGSIDPKCPLLWDFPEITSAQAFPYDEKPLTVSGGIFTTIANQAESKYTYFARNICIKRSNTTLTGMAHYVTGEGEHGAPYTGFVNVMKCADVLVKDCILSGHKIYRTIGSANKPVSMGTYDIGANTAANVTFLRVKQANDINNRSLWGIMGTNYCKNLVYDSCMLSRFDAHQGVANATIRNTHLGYCGASVIGFGLLTLENCTFNSDCLASLRGDYGSTWEGSFLVKNCVLEPSPKGKVGGITLFNGSNNGKHDFGYQCFMPAKIFIDGLHIKDAKHTDKYQGPFLFSNFMPSWKDNASKPQYPMHITREVHIRRLIIDSGKKLQTSSNSFLFRNTKITLE